MLDKKFFLKEGPNVRDRYRDHIFRKARDVYDKPFSKNYNTKYLEKKRKGGKGFIGGYPINAPVASGMTLEDYGMVGTPSSTGFTIGWSIMGGRVQSLRNQGRILTHQNQPLPKKIFKYLTDKAHKYIVNQSGKITGAGKTKVHKIGKK